MSLLLESIKYENGQLHNLKYHEARMQYALLKVHGKKIQFDLKKIIAVPANVRKGLYKCRIVYDTCIVETKFCEYKRKKIEKVHLIIDEHISYPHKFDDRDCINTHTKNLPKDEEIIIVKKDMLRDASYSNIALYNGSEWHTPTYPLLKGTKRAELLEKGIIKSKKIHVQDLKNYHQISFINALNDLGELSLKL